MISACLASKFANAVCSPDDAKSSETVVLSDVLRIVAIFGVSRQSRDGNYP